MTAVKKYIATETTQEAIRGLVADIKNSINAGAGGSGVTPHLTVTAPAGSTVTASDGTVTLEAVVSGGTYQFNLPHLGTWTVTTSKDGFTNTNPVAIKEVREYTLKTAAAVRYGFRIKKNEGNPSARVEYLYDAVDFTPAHMDYTNGVFNYGDWGDKWFVTENKPCMLKDDGTVDYYLNPNDYSIRADTDGASDVDNTAYNGNAMAQFPLVWVKRYEQAGYEYEIISNVQYDEDYKAYAHTRADGSIADFFYYSMFGGSGSAAGIRSLAGQTLAQSLTAQQEINGCKANGSLWYTHSWSQRELIRTLLILMGKSTDTQTVFGNGNCRSATAASGLLTTGTLKDKGQFFGYNSNTQQVKVFHVEGFWGDQWDRTAGLIATNTGRIYIKMTPEGQGYRVTDTNGYTDTGITVPASVSGGTPIVGGRMTEYGFIPTAGSGSGSTYYCDHMWGYTSGNPANYLLAGASSGDATAVGGAFAWNVANAPSYARWGLGCGLSCEQPAAA